MSCIQWSLEAISFPGGEITLGSPAIFGGNAKPFVGWRTKHGQGKLSNGKVYVDWSKGSDTCTVVAKDEQGRTGKLAIIEMDEIELSVFLKTCADHNRNVDLWTEEETDDDIHRDRSGDEG